MSILLRSLVSVAVCAALSACGGGGSSDTMVVNTSQVVHGGNILTYQLNPGIYSVEVSSSNIGVRVEWLGSSSCVGSYYLTRLYKERCALNVSGQLIIRNLYAVSQTVVVNGTPVTLSSSTGTGSVTLNGVVMTVSYDGNKTVTINNVALTLNSDNIASGAVDGVPVTAGLGGDETVTVKVTR